MKLSRKSTLIGQNMFAYNRYIFLLSLFYISTTTRHTLENRRFLEANSNEKFCGTIRETLCECAAPSSMESYIYIYI